MPRASHSWGWPGVGALLYSAMLRFCLVAIVFVEVPGSNLSRPTMFAPGVAGALVVLPLTWGLTGWAFRSKSFWYRHRATVSGTGICTLWPAPTFPGT